MQASPRPPAILLMGPTASGKTDLAIELAGEIDCELVSVDSALVYRGMDIGTAKPLPSVLARFPHRLIDIRDPQEAYSAADFRRDALVAIDDIHAAGRIPLLVGGSMLYFRVLLDGIADLPSGDAALRARLATRLEREGPEQLHAELLRVDPAAASHIHPHNAQRLLRALEVWELTGTAMSTLQGRTEPEPLPFRPIQLAIAPWDRSILHRRIEKRFQAMLDAGLVEEVRQLGAAGNLPADLPSMRAVGYRQVLAYLGGHYTYEEMVERGIIATRQLAKRQMTWLRSWPGLEWVLTDAEQFCVNADGTRLLEQGCERRPHSHVLKFLQGAAI